jgi:Domain of unknown function (DUF4114)
MTNQTQLKLSGTIQLDGAEISAYDPISKRFFTTGESGGKPVLQITDISDPTKPTKIGNIDLSTFGAGIQSVAVRKGTGGNSSIVAVAISATTATDPGKVVFFDAAGSSATPLSQVTVGALPDMLTFTPDGTKLLVANEGEPKSDYTIDPEGSISIIDVSGNIAALDQTKVTTANFQAFNGQEASLKAQGIRIFGPNASTSQDLEPEYIAVSADSKTAFVTLQENNAFAIVDIASGRVTSLKALGFKDHNQTGKGMDASDKDSKSNNIKNWPVLGMYLPDAISSFQSGGKTYYLTANEGDSRDYSAFSEEARIKTLNLDATAFPNAADLKLDANIGRLKVTKTLGDTDGDGDYDQLYTFGGRSFSVWDEAGNLVFDSGDQLEKIIAEKVPSLFNANYDTATNKFTADDRSDDKGPEPEAVTIGYIDGKPYAFIGLERASGGVLMYDLSNPTAPEFVQYIYNEKDISPEGLSFISAQDSPNGKPLLLVSNEISGTATVYEVNNTNNFVGGGKTSAPAYVNNVTGGSEYDIVPLLTAGDEVALLEGTFGNYTASATKTYAFAGIPDGLGHTEIDGKHYVWVNHEFGNTVTTDISSTVSGQIKGARVSLFVFDENWNAIGGRNLIQTVQADGKTYNLDTTSGDYKAGDGTILNAATGTNLNRFCSGYLAENGFTNGPIWFAPEESGDNSRGWAVTPDGTAIALDGLGKYSKEQVVAASQYRAGNASGKTVLISTEDNGDGEIYMYLGNQSADDPNGLTASADGSDFQLYVLRVKDAQGNVYTNETMPENVKLTAEWVLVPDDKALGSGSDLSTWVNGNDSNVLRSTNFRRPEDIHEDPNNPGTFYTVMTGTNDKPTGATEPDNTYGTLYRFKLNSTDPTGQMEFEFLMKGGENTGVSFDNMTVDSNGNVLIQEDRTAGGETLLANQQRQGRVLSYNIADNEGKAGNDNIQFLFELNQAAIDPTVATDYGNWESSGIVEIQSASINNQSAYLFDVQAHSIKNAEGFYQGRYAEGGQLVIALPKTNDTGLTPNTDNIFTIGGSSLSTAHLKAQISSSNSSSVNEVGYFIVNDNAGTIVDGNGNSLTPAAGEAYIKAALEQSQVLFSSIANKPNGFNPTSDSRIIEDVTGGDRLVFYFIENGSTDGVLENKVSTSQVKLGSNFGSASLRELTTTDLGNDKFSLAWGGGKMTLTLETTNDSAPLGSGLQGGNNAELLDLRGISGQVNASFSVYREAAFNNEVYFYKVDNADGLIGSLDPDSANPNAYLQAALGNLVKDPLTGSNVKLNAPNQNVQTSTAKVEAGSIFAPMIIINGTLEQLTDNNTNNNPTVYFPYLGANTDGIDHIRLLGNNTFGFEDLPIGGDVDYNDMIVKINFTV